MRVPRRRTRPRVRRPWVTATILASAVFLVLFDSLSVAAALPTIGRQFSMAPRTLQWVVNVYSLSVGGLLLLGGRVTDVFGSRRTLVTSLTVLTLGASIAGTAPSVPLLLCGRLLQGIAAAFAIPAALAMAATLFPAEPWRSRALSVVAVSSGAAGLAGAIVGGALTTALGWRWVFLATVPAGVVALLNALRTLPHDSPRTSPSGRLDVTGAVLASSGIGLLILGIDQVGRREAAVLYVAGPAVGGLLLLAAFVVVERRATHPLLRLGLLRSRRLAGGCAGIAGNSVSYSAVIVVGSLFLQRAHHFSAAAAGLALTPALLGTTAGGLIAASLVRRLGSRAVATGSLSLAAASLLLLGTGAASGSYVVSVLPWFFLRGLSGGAAYVALTRETLGNSLEEDRGATSAIFESTTHISGGTAVAVYVTLLASTWGYRGAYLAGAVIVALACVAVFLTIPKRSRRRRSTYGRRPSDDHRRIMEQLRRARRRSTARRPLRQRGAT